MSFVSTMFENSPYRDYTICPGSLVTDITNDIRNAIAIAQAMFGPENIRNTNSNFQMQSDLSTATIDEDKFQASFDMQHFKPEEITVKITGDSTVTVEAKHEEKQDEHGHIYRHFIRKYVLPDNCDVGRLESRLSSDGVLIIAAPYLDSQSKQRTIPIALSLKPQGAEKKTEAMSCN